MDFDYSTETITPDNTTLLTIGGTGAIEVPSGTTANRPVTGLANGALRYNADVTALEAYIGSGWSTLSTGGTAVSTFSGGTTGLTPNSATSGAVTLAGTLVVGNGGTGITTTPSNGQLLVGNGTNYTVATLGTGTGISITAGAGTLQVNNTGVTSNVAGTNITVSAATGAVTIATSTTPSFSTVTSTVAIGTAPFTVTSTTNVANLNASSLNGATFAAPGSIGSGTAAAGAFTTLSASSTVSGTGFSTYLASPPAIGGTAAAAGAFTTLSATGVITSTQTTGTAPFTVATTTNVANLNASSLSGATFAAPGTIGGTTPGIITGTTITANTGFAGAHNGTVGATTPNTGAFTTISATGAITSTLATGSAPFVVASTTNVANLNASSLNGATFAAPGAIGGGTAAAITGTTINGTTITASVAFVGSLTGHASLDLPLTGGSMTGTVTMDGTHTITGLPLPTNDSDAATKLYVDTAVSNVNVHDAAHAATTASLTVTYTAGSADQWGGTGINATLTNAGTQVSLATGSAFDGYTGLALGNRVLVKNQSTQTQNGIYTVTNMGSGATNWILTRATDYNNSNIVGNQGQVAAGDLIFVQEGTTQGSTSWIETGVGTGTNDTIIIGTNNIVFTQFSGAGTYSAGTGLSLTGTVFANTGVLSVTSNTGLSTNTSATGNVTITNTGVTSNVAGTNITVSGATGAVTIGTSTTPSFSTVASTVATGTAPFTVASTTNVANLNASSLSGATFAAPGAIGGGTAAAITGTTITANTGFAGAHNGTVGATTPNTGAFTTISATGVITSTQATGSAPFVVASTTNVANLNASSLSGATFAAPGAIGSTTASTGAFTTLSATGVITSTLASGTAPFTVASTTNVANLNASSLNGATFAAPGTIGNTTAAAITGTTITANTSFAGALNGTVGATTANTGAFTTLSATGVITSTLASGTAPFTVASTTNVANLNASSLSGATFAAPGAIGGGTASTGAFTTISATGVITSTQTTGTAPFTVASTTNVANLNASSLSGATFAAPGAIGGGTAAAGTFTALTATGVISHATTTNNQTYSTTGAGVISISSGTTGSINNMNIGATTAGTGAFTTITGTGLTANSFLYTGTAGLLSTTSAPTNGQLLIGSTGAVPVAATLSVSGTSIYVTNGAGSITLAGPKFVSEFTTAPINAPTATASQSIAIGTGAKAATYGVLATANGQFATAGDAQAMQAVYRAITTTTGASELFLDGAGATQRLVLPNNSAWTFSIKVVARRTDAIGTIGSWIFTGVIYQDVIAPITPAISGLSKTTIARVGNISTSANDPTVSADTTYGSLKISVPGIAANTIRWVATVDLAQVTN